MHKCYHPLACDERCQIRVLRSRGFSMRSIARDLGRDPAAISREMARNRGGCGYRHRQAQEKAVAGRSALAGTRALTARPKAPRIHGLVHRAGRNSGRERCRACVSGAG